MLYHFIHVFLEDMFVDVILIICLSCRAGSATKTYLTVPQLIDFFNEVRIVKALVLDLK